MYGDFLKAQEPEVSKSPPHPEAIPSITAPSTTKKKVGFGRLNVKLAPLRASAVPELSQLYNEAYNELAKNGRRSDGTVFSQNESHELAHSTNNTIPETLNSSREWNLPGRSLFSSSQNDLRTISESTPLKSSQRDHQHGRAPLSLDKENFYTPRKAPEGFAASTPAARCPLSALPVDSAPVKDTIDGVSSHKSLEMPPNHGGTGFLGSTQKSAPDNIFRTPQCKVPCKIAPNQLNSIHASGRQRLYGISSSQMSHIRLHPAVAAGQQHAKQLQQQSGASRKLADSTPFQSAPALDAKPSAMGAVHANPENQPSQQEGRPQSSNSWILDSRPAETTPFKAVSNLKSTPLMQITGHPIASSSEKQPLPSSDATGESSLSNWSLKANPGATYSRAPHVQSMDGANQRHCQETPLLQSVKPPPSSKRKLETNVVEAAVVPNEDKQLQKVSPVQVREMKLIQCAPKLHEPAKVDSAVPRIVPNPPVCDTRCPQQPSINSKELPTKKTETPIPVLPEPVKDVQCPAQQATKPVEPPVIKVTTPTDPTDSAVIAAAPSSRGIMVNGRVYNILSLLGTGGSSKVFQVLDPETTELKAVKCVNMADTDPVICEGYLNEINLLAELQGGESVIRMFDHEHKKEERLLLVVMEKGDTDLSRLIKSVNSSKQISAAMIVYYWTEMLNAVNFIHKRGTIHSDLKPANFLLVSGRLKLIDFGIASSVQEDMTSVVKECMTGTYNYISPEALSSSSNDGQGFKISYKSDVWSLGCILYSLVFGRTPFQHITGQFQKLNAIVSPNYKIEFPEPLVKGCPSALIQAMKMCFVRNPKDRASVEELLQLPYLEQAGPERGILSQFAQLAASVGLVHETDSNSYAKVIRAMQRLIIENERHLPFLRKK